ncbi:M3 family metallopeptidase [Stenotrophomonas sp. W1S232]|uniref:oligopeptidase A n=1 Tax=Stenotrophomonas koreensis TaxID=266128 RepID=A0A7W3UYK9_9GAMM|nr:M3 family metallopeptidase [Stenotrophomonas koreensis]MBB1115662.1 M3 family metallopeptidase [Stenotrophomonas koreensis]
MTNPLLDFSGLPRFDAITPAHVTPAIDTLLAQARAAVEQARTQALVNWENFVVPLDDATERLYRAWGQVSHLEAVVNSPELRAAYNENLPKVTRFGSELAQDLALYAQYRKLADSPEAAGYDAARQQVLAHTLRSFRLGGAELDEAGKARLAAINEELSSLSARFSQNVLDATDAFALYVDDVAELAGLPDDVLVSCRAAAEAEGRSGFKLTLQMPCYLPLQTYCDNRSLREQLYRASVTRASEFGPAELDNSALIARVLALRAEKAALLGMDSYAEYSLATKMADDPDQVLAFLDDLARRARPFAQADRAELEAFARDELGLDTLQAWDLAWASDKLKQARYSYSAQQVKQYFTEDRVLAGLFGLIGDLYGLKVEPDSAPTWHPDVRFYRLVTAQGDLVGQFYLDPYAREGKRGGAWMDDCRNRRLHADGRVQTPLVYLVCNFGRGVDGKPATLTHDEVTTLFHEMGHGLHQLLTRIGELGVAGINGVEWDAVELPSQFMENFCWEWSRVQAMTAHVDTGAHLPRPLFDKLLAAKNFQSGMATVRQLEFALFDMRIHHGFDPAGDVLALLDTVRAEVAVNIPPAFNRFPHQFSHIFAGGYAAGYYSYKWAEVLSADAYAAFEEAGEEQLAATGQRFLAEILSRGGSRPAAENFRAFRGREPSIDALLRHNGMAA